MAKRDELLSTLKVLEEMVLTLRTGLDICQDELQYLRSQTQEDKWVSLKEAALSLGPVFSEEKIRDDIRAGFLTYGKHYVDTSNGKKANYAAKVSALRKFYSTPPESRCPSL